jgi:hypothetical protein
VTRSLKCKANATPSWVSLLTDTIFAVNHYNLLQLSQVPVKLRQPTRLIRSCQQNGGGHTMSPSIRSFTFSRLAGVVAGLWLSAAGLAWAGDGGSDLGTLNNALADLCSLFEGTYGINLPSCPQAPTITQAVLQVAAWNLVPTEMISATNSIPLGDRVNAGSPSIPPVGPIPPPVTTFPVQGTALSNLLTNLTPLAFISSSPGPAKATQLYSTDADIFFYAVASLSHSSTQSAQPDTLYLFYDDTARTNANLMQGQIVANISLPLVVLSSDGTTERQVPTRLQFRVPAAGGPPCSASTVVGNFSGAPTAAATATGTQTLMASQIGLNCAVVFAPSPLSTKSHAIFEVQVPLVVTMTTDPLFFSNPISNVSFSFKSDDPGFPPQTPILGANGKSIGIGPAAVPLGAPPAGGTGTTFALCANLPGGNGNGQPPVPAVAAYYAISTVGEALLSAAIPSASTSVCPF